MAGPFDFMGDSSKAAAVPGTPGGGGPFDFMGDSSKADQSPQDYTQATLTAGQNVRRPWEETAALLKEKGVNPEPHRAGYELALARVASDKEGDSTLGTFYREYAPFTEVFDARGDKEYTRARGRFQKGEAKSEDYRVIADYERRQKQTEEMQKSVAGNVVHGVGKIARIGGEVATGGAILGAFGKGAAAAGEVAAPAAEAALPTLLGSTTAHSVATGLAKSAGSFVVTPAMYLEDARSRNMAAGKDVDDPSGYKTAVPLGFANWLVLGRLQGRIAGTKVVDGKVVANELGLAGRLLGAPAVGVGEQALVDVGAGLLDALGVTESVAGGGNTFGTKGGIFGRVARGELGEAGRDALTQFLTFSIAAGLHESPKVWDAIRGDKKPDTTDAEKAAKEKFAAMVKAYDGVADDLMKRGMGKEEAYGLASKYVTDLGRRLTDAGGGGLVKTKSDAEDYLGHLPEGAARDFGKLLASAFPDGPRTERPYAIPLSERAQTPDQIAQANVRKNAPVIDEALAAPPQPNAPYTPPGGGLGFRREAAPATPTPDQVARAKLRGEAIPVATAPPIPPSGRTPWQHTAAGQDQPGRVTHEDVARAQAQHDKVQSDVLALSREVSRQEGMNREGLATPDLGHLKDRLDYLTSKLKGHRARLGDMKVALEKQNAIPQPSPPLTHSFPTPTSGVVVGKNVGFGRNVVVGRGGPETPPESPGSSPASKPPETVPTPAGGDKTPPSTNGEVSRPTGEIDPNEVANEYERLKASGVPPGKAFLQATENVSKLPVREQEKKDVESQLKRTDDAPLADDAKQELSETATAEGENSGVRLADGVAQGEAGRAAGGEGSVAPASPGQEGLPGGPRPANAPQGPTARTARQAVLGRAGAKGGNARPYVTPEEAKGVPIEHVREILRSGKIPFGATESQASLVAKFSKLGARENILLRHEVAVLAEEKVTKKVKKADPEQPPEPEPTPIELRERVIDASNYPKHVKEGMKLLLSEKPLSVREAGKVASAGGESITGETLRKNVEKLFGKSPYEIMKEVRAENDLRAGGGQIEFSSAKASKQMRKESARSGGDLPPDAYGHPLGGHETSPGSPGVGKGEPPSPHQIIQTQNTLLDANNYVVKSIPFGERLAAVALTKPGAIVTGEMSAHDPVINLEEHAHILASKLGFTLDPKALPSNVAEGLRQFYGRRSPMEPRSIMEGFGQWLVRRTLGTLDKLTPDQRAADTYAEAWLNRQKTPGGKKLGDVLDRLGEMHRSYGSSSAIEKVGSMSGKDGKSGPVATAGERASDFLSRTLDDQARKKLDDLYDLRQYEVQAEATRLAENVKRKARGEKEIPAPAPGTLPSEQWRANRYRSTAMANEMNMKGVFGYDKDGRQVILSKSYTAIAEEHGLSAKDIDNGGRLDSYMRAKEGVYLADQKRPNRPPDQIETMRQALREFAKDPGEMKRLEAAAKDVTALFDATIKAQEMAGFLPEGSLGRMQKKNPFYTPNTRLMGEDSPLSKVKGKSRGGAPSPGFLKKRGNSGEETIGLKDAVQDRLEYLAYVIPKQMKDKSFYDSARANLYGDDVVLHPMELTKAGEKALADLRAGGMAHDEAYAHLDAMGDAAKDYFLPGSWPANAKQDSYVMMVGGKPIRAMIGSRPLHELLTGTQGEGETVMKVADALSAVARPVAQLQRIGFTMLSPLYHIYNRMPWRDRASYLGRTVSEKGFLKDVADVTHWYNASLWYYAGRLFGKTKGDPYFKLYDDMVQRSLSADYHRGLGSDKVIDGGWRGLYQRVTDVMGSGEKALHVAEMKNVWDKAGWTRERIEAELKKDPSANPIPFPLQVAALNAAGAVTHNFTTMGYQVRALNKAWPFLGVHIASAYKDIQTFRTNPKLALRGLGVIAACKAIQWALYKDDEEFKQLSHVRRDGFMLKTPVGYVYMPGPRGIQTPIVGVMDEVMRATSNSNPQFLSLLGRGLEHTLPGGGPAGVTTGLELLANKTRGAITGQGSDIVPKAEEKLSALRKGLKYRAPYAVEQLTGSIVAPTHDPRGQEGKDESIGREAARALLHHYDPTNLALPPQHEGVTRLKSEVASMEEDERLAKDRGERYPDLANLTRLRGAVARINHMTQQLNKMPAPTSEQKVDFNRRQVEIAKGVLDKK